MRKITRSEEETRAFARSFAKKLRGGEVLALDGELGAGKTAFVKGLADALGVKRTINSPTFVLMKVYPVELAGAQAGIRHFVHVDAYRISGGQALAGIGLEDYIASPEAVVAIEWAERVNDILPRDAVRLFFSHTGEEKRAIESAALTKGTGKRKVINNQAAPRSHK